jgi:predicted amidohydrolase
VPSEPGFLACCDEWEVYLKKYQELARELSICIVPGTIVERHTDAKTEAESLINVAYFIGKGGEVLGKYIKKNLWYAVHFPPSLIPLHTLQYPLLT